ncbi:hypothetical protein GCM10022247_71690 [Allokutzneria multivorans]|uniref:DUF397 domain-containing protein n=1 Tax=Allokutzneria multivorans TaxID=1142134 RepID=A0ABP7U4G9_9PSEU
MRVPDSSGVLWRKSSRSNGSGNECVEIGFARTRVLIRDSKNPDGPALTFGPAAWNRFLGAVKAGCRGAG